MFVYRSFWIFVLLKIVSSATISDEDIDKILGTRTDLGTDGGTDGYPSMADIDELKARLGAFAGLQDEPNFPGDMLESRENEDEEGLDSDVDDVKFPVDMTSQSRKQFEIINQMRKRMNKPKSRRTERQRETSITIGLCGITTCKPKKN